MPVSPADFALWARATGNKYPETAEEKVAAAPHAYEYAKNLGRRGQTSPSDRVGGRILYNSPESVQNPSPNSLFDAPVTPDNDAPKISGTVDRTLTSEHFVNQREQEARDNSRTRQIIDVVGKTALAAGTLAAGAALAQNPGVQQAVRNAGTTLTESAQNIGSRVSSFLGGFGGQQATNPSVVRNSGDITPPPTSEEYNQRGVPTSTQTAQVEKTYSAGAADPWTGQPTVTKSVSDRAQDFLANVGKAPLVPGTSAVADPWHQPDGPTQSELISTTQSFSPTQEATTPQAPVTSPRKDYSGSYSLSEYERKYPPSAELTAARRQAATDDLLAAERARANAPTSVQPSIPGVNPTLYALRAQGDVDTSAGEILDATARGWQRTPSYEGTQLDIPFGAAAQPSAGERAANFLAQKTGQPAGDAPVSEQTSDLIPNASSAGERAADFLSKQQPMTMQELYPSSGAEPELNSQEAVSVAPQSSVYDVTQSSAVRFLGNERQKIASELVAQGRLATPMRVETELARRLGSKAGEYGPKYSARRQGLELYAQTGDPRLLSKVQMFGLAPVTFESFETMPAAKRAGFETAAPFTTDYYPGTEVSPVGLRSNINVNVPGEGSVSLASLRKPVITEETARAADEFVQNARQQKMDWLSGVENEVTTQRNNILAERRDRARQIGMGLASQLVDAQKEGNIGKAEQIQASLQALRNIYRNPELSAHREGEMRQLNARLAGAKRSTEQQIAGIRKKFPTTLNDWSGEARRFYGEVDPSTGDYIPETVELRAERKTADLPEKGGGGRNIAEYTAGERLHEAVRQLQGGGRMRDYDETGAPVQHWVGDNTQTGREIDAYGVRLSSERPADPGLRPSEPQYRPDEIRAEAMRMSSADPYGDVPVAPEYEDVVESLGRYQGPRTRQQRMRAADVTETIRRIQASGRPTAQQEVKALLSSLAEQEGTQVPPRSTIPNPPLTAPVRVERETNGPSQNMYRAGAGQQLSIPRMGFGQTSAPDKAREVVRQSQLNDLLAKYTGRSLKGALQGALYTQPTLF